MSKNPILNALAAGAYISLVASIMYYGSHVIPDTPDTIFAPIAMISLFVLSAAVMGYLFVFQPLVLYMDGQKKEAVGLFMKTVGAFALLTVLFFAALLLL